MTSTEPYTTATSQAWLVAEKSVEAWRNGATTFTDQLDRAALPAIDLTDLSVTQTEMAVQTAKQQAERVAGKPARDVGIDESGRDRERASGQ